MTVIPNPVLSVLRNIAVLSTKLPVCSAALMLCTMGTLTQRGFGTSVIVVNIRNKVVYIAADSLIRELTLPPQLNSLDRNGR